MKAAIVLMLTNNKEQELHEMLRSAEIPDAIRKEWAVKTITRAIARGRKKAVPLAWLEWADKWVSGGDRTAKAAQAAFKVEWSQNAPVPNVQTALHVTRAAYDFASAESWMLRNNRKYECVGECCLRCADWSVAWVNNSNVSRRIRDIEITKQLDDLLTLIEGYTEQLEITKQLDDLLTLIEGYTKQLDDLLTLIEGYTEGESISDKLFNAAETELERAVARIAGKRESEDFVKDVLSGGCVNGTVGELIYTADCVAFYRKHKKDIQKLVTELMSDCGIDSMKGLFGDNFDAEDPFCEEDENQNLLAWFGFEEALRTLAYRIELDI
jgi:hypothetical protein